MNAHGSINGVPAPWTRSGHFQDAIGTSVHAGSPQGTPCCSYVRESLKLYRIAEAHIGNAIRTPQAPQGHRANSDFHFVFMSERRAAACTLCTKHRVRPMIPHGDVTVFPLCSRISHGV